MLVELSDEAKGVRFLEDLLDILRNWVEYLPSRYCTHRELSRAALHTAV